MESANEKMTLLMKSALAEYLTAVIGALSGRYNFPAAEAVQWVLVGAPMTAPMTAPVAAVPVTAVAPKKKGKAVVNKAEVVEDVIARLMNAPAEVVAAAAAPKKKSSSKKAAPEVAPGADAPGAEVAAPKKKSTSKKAAPVVTEVAAPVVTEVAAPVVTEVAAPKKKSSSKKAVAAEAAPVVTEVAAPKKKSTSKKAATAEAPAEVVIESAAVVAELTDEAYDDDENDEHSAHIEEFEFKGITYGKCQNNIIYNSETLEHIGRWNGKAIEFFPEDE